MIPLPVAAESACISYRYNVYPCSLAVNAGAGLFYETAADLAFPIDEVASSSLLMAVFCIASSIYTMLGSAIPPEAMNWMLTGAPVAYCQCIVL